MGWAPKGFRQFSPQKGLLMRMLGVGQRKVWLDPTKMDIISKAKTRKELWDLIHQGVVRRKFSPRGRHEVPGGPFLYLKQAGTTTTLPPPAETTPPAATETTPSQASQ